MNEIRTLFREYETELNEDLCFQSFEAELKDPLQKYGPPKGILYLALWNNEAAGCIALMPLQEDGVCEMKRLFVRPAFRKHQIGKVLVKQLLKDAAQLGYATMKLDTLQKLEHSGHITQVVSTNTLRQMCILLMSILTIQ